jgi:predicted Zn finger-like uncharacterized protein
MVVVRCPGCAARYRVPEKLIDKKVKCKKCGKPFRIAGPPPAEEEDDLLGTLADGWVACLLQKQACLAGWHACFKSRHV